MDIMLLMDSFILPFSFKIQKQAEKAIIAKARFLLSSRNRNTNEELKIEQTCPQPKHFLLSKVYFKKNILKMYPAHHFMMDF